MPERAAGVERVREEIKPAEVLDLLVAPDYVGHRQLASHRRAEVWEFDIAVEPAYTPRVEWDIKALRVKSTQRLTPALWQSNTRDDDID